MSFIECSCISHTRTLRLARVDGEADVAAFAHGRALCGAISTGFGETVRATAYAICGFGAFFLTRLGVRVTTRRGATHCARGSRFARCHSTFCDTSSRLSLYPSA